MSSHSHTKAFLEQLLNRPHQIVALAPSSRKLCNMMASNLDPKNGPVAELGVGTGKITESLINAGFQQTQLELYEMNSKFCEILRERFPNALIKATSAANVRNSDLSGVQAVVSGLPLLSFSTRLQFAIVKGAFDILKPGGVFVQYTYGVTPPVRSKITQRLGLTYNVRGRVWENLPPARVFVYRRPIH